ncbi:YicC/YloC family endoribonuclease [uncultured Tenacibaculum sp.]|uniref:YicC/YloC family endoribonuclease n=1 Tax=uncultured Tenacibaculum sp. TaxID=174713 RepID=UPI002627AA14|nr:YicC/YloC family endoribonuclease [uncultured Tenacibaculum sp.]
MIQSMTGYGKSVLHLPSKKVTIEVKSLNSKNLDLNTRIPSYYREKELDVRKKLASSLVRGKVDFSIYVEMTADETSTTVNTGVVREYMQQLRNVTQVGSSDDVELMKMAVRMPDALKTEREELDEEEWNQIDAHIDEALKEIIQYRIDEAQSLEEDFKTRITNIQTALEEVKKLDGDRIAHVKERLQKALTDLKVEVDENRFEQELIYYLEKLDINEEKVRLANHLEYFLQQLETSDSNGKKLGFIVQEIGREINTTGSKANFAPIQKLVIQMKDELEKIKEQILNVL